MDELPMITNNTKQCGLPELDYIVLVYRSCGNSDHLDDRNIPDALQKYITAHPYK